MMKQRLQKILTMATLVCVALVLGCMTVAYAGNTSLGAFAYMNDYCAGDSLMICWNVVDGSDHYDCTVLNTTTGEYLRSRAPTSSYYECYVGNVPAGRIKIWVGAVDGNGDVITSETLYVTVAEKSECDHRYSSKDGCCKKCGEECPHNNGYYEIETKTNAKSVSDTEHKMTITYDKECKICRYAFETGLKKTKYQDHSFDSNGDCKECDYRAACTHSKTTLELLSTSYTYVNESEHKVKEVSNIVCANANCGKLIEYGGDIETYREDHTFKNGTCTACGYSKVEKLSVSVSRGSATAVVGSGISGSCSAKGGSGSYQYAWIAKCNGAVMDETDYSADAWRSFGATQAGTWTLTVIVRDRETGETVTATTGGITVTEPVCTHESYTEVAQPDKAYEKISDENHKVKITYDRYCNNCGKIISTFTKSETEKHTYSNGNCTRCGAAEPTPVCSHSEKKSSEIKRSIYQLSSASQHGVKITWLDVCASCGVTLNTTRTTDVKEDHAFNADGVCACGYTLVKECDHASPAKNYVSSSVQSVNAKSHMTTTVYRLVCQCGVVVNERYEEYSYADHRMVNGKCQDCGYSCAHSKTEKTRIDSHVEIEDEKTHRLITVYQIKCESCGTVIEARHEETSWLYHTMEGRKCTRCGYEVKCDHAVVTTVEKEYYQSVNDKQHRLVQVIRHRCDCGEVNYTEEKLGALEDHDYPNLNPNETANNVCRKCGSMDEIHSWVMNSEKAHPHHVYFVCSVCNSRVGDSEGMVVENLSCCDCVGHDWASGGFYNGQVSRMCNRCGLYEQYSTSEAQAAEEMHRLYNVTKENAESYRKQHGLEGNQSSLWTIIAGQATDKLTQKGFVLGVNVMDTLGNQSEAIREAAADLFISKDEYTEQQIELWKELILDTLMNDTSEAVSDSQVKECYEIGKDVYDIGDTGLDIYKWLQKKNAEKEASEAGQKVGEAAKKTSEAGQKTGKEGIGMSEVFLGIDVVVAIEENSIKAQDIENTYFALAADYFNNLAKLGAIIEEANAAGATTLSAAAQEIADDLTKKYIESVEDLDNMVEYIHDQVMSAGGVTINADTGREIAGIGFDYLFDKVTEKNLLLNAFSGAAEGVALLINHDEVYRSAEELMALSTMNASMSNITMRDLTESDDDIVYKLWAHLQMKGVDGAKDFIEEHETTPISIGVHIRELGIEVKDYNTVLNQLNHERELYENYANSRD